MIVVALPAAALEALKTHMTDYVGQDPDSLIFTGAKGSHLRASRFGPAVKYQDATSERDREIARSMDRRIARKAGPAADREGGRGWPGHQA
jgi:hypothetical protein